MSYLGARCTHNDYSIAILSGSAKNPTLEEIWQNNFPQGISDGKRLRWFLIEIEEKIKNHKIKTMGIKKCESLTGNRDRIFQRLENEAIVFLAAENKGINLVFRKAYATIAKDLGFLGKKTSLSKVDYTIFPNHEKLNDKAKDAILVAWSVMK